MGQSASKAASRVAAAAAGKKGPAVAHIPSVPGKAGGRAAAADPRTGFTRGSGMSGSGGAGSPQEEAQRQFLQAQQGSAAEFKDKLPDDLIKFMTDVGPLKRSEDNEKNGAAVKRLRLPRNFANNNSNSDEMSNNTVSQNPAADKTRKTENMRLAENIEGFETSRTTSFSHKEDVVDPNDAGLDVVQFYSLLTGKSTIGSYCPIAIIDDKRDRQMLLLEQSMLYLQIPVLLKDSDDTYVGAWPEKSKDLQQEHVGMVEVPSNRAKLVLADLWETEQTKKQGEKALS